MADPRTDQEILCALQSRGDRTALAVLFDRYGKKVYALAFGILRNRSDAEDIVQEVFETVWKKSATYQSALGEPKYWLLRIAHNRSINSLKSRALRMPGIAEAAAGGTPEDTAAHESIFQETLETPEFDIAEILSSALGSLPVDQRRLIELAFFKGFSHSEIAENEKLPLGTVKTRIRSGMMKLRSELDFLRN